MSMLVLLAQSLPGTQPVQQAVREAQTSTAWIQFFGVLTAGVFLLLAQFLVHWFTRKRAREDRLSNLFAELVGIATDDLSRSKWQESMLHWRPDPGTEELLRNLSLAVPDWNKLWQKYEDDRDNNRRELSRVQCQIRLIEHDEGILNAVELVASSQPFYPLPWRAIEQQPLDDFKSKIAEFEKNLVKFMDLVVKERSR